MAAFRAGSYTKAWIAFVAEEALGWRNRGRQVADAMVGAIGFRLTAPAGAIAA